METERASPSSSSYLLLVLLLAVIAALSWGIWRVIDALDPGVAAAVIAAIATVIISVVSLIYQRRWEQRRAIQEAQREHKRGVYEEFIQFLFRIVSDPPSEDEVQRWAVEFHPKLILWGANEIVTEYGEFRRISLFEEVLGARAAALLALHEACANVIEHAYGDSSGTLLIEAVHGGDTLSIRVTDHGTWREPVDGTDRGRGVMLMRGLIG